MREGDNVTFTLGQGPKGPRALFTKVQIRPPKGVIGAGMGLGHRRLQAEPGFEQPTGGA